jgi:hypothetical protein
MDVGVTASLHVGGERFQVRKLRPHQRGRAQPAEAALDRSLVRRIVREELRVGLPDAGQRAVLGELRDGRVGGALQGFGSARRWRPDADSSSAARRPPTASSSVFIEVMNDFTPSSSRP